MLIRYGISPSRNGPHPDYLTTGHDAMKILARPYSAKVISSICSLSTTVRRRTIRFLQHLQRVRRRIWYVLSCPSGSKTSSFRNIQSSERPGGSSQGEELSLAGSLGRLREIQTPPETSRTNQCPCR